MNDLQALYKALRKQPRDAALRCAIIDETMAALGHSRELAEFTIDAELHHIWQARQIDAAARLLKKGSRYRHLARFAIRAKIEDIFLRPWCSVLVGGEEQPLAMFPHSDAFGEPVRAEVMVRVGALWLLRQYVLLRQLQDRPVPQFVRDAIP